MDKVRAAVGMVDEAPEPEGSTEKVKAGTAAAAATEVFSPTPACMGAASTGRGRHRLQHAAVCASKPAAAAMRTTLQSFQKQFPCCTADGSEGCAMLHRLTDQPKPPPAASSTIAPSSSLRSSACSDRSHLPACIPACLSVSTRCCCPLLRNSA